MQQRNQSAQQPRGVQGRPDVRAREKSGEERVVEIFAENKPQIVGLLATDGNAEAGFLRAQALAVAAYRKAQADSDVKIDEMSMCATCIWALRQKLDVGTEVWPVPYAGKITPIISPDGMLTLLYRSGLVVDVNFSAVFHGDEFEYVLGTTNEIKHRKMGVRPMARMDRGKVQKNDDLWNALTGVWCVIKLKSGGQVCVVFNRSEIEYFRSLSPFGASASSPWAKFGDAMAEVRAMKRAAKRGPKSTELSAILLSSEDSDGVEIPDEIMKAVGARMLNEMTGDPGAGSNGGAAPGNAEQPPPETQHSKRQPPKAGDPQRSYMPGTPPQSLIANADNDALIAADKRGRGALDNNKWSEQYFDKNAIQLATIRAEMRARNIAVPPHPFLDAHLAPPPAEHEPEQEQTFHEYGNEREPGMEG